MVQSFVFAHPSCPSQLDHTLASSLRLYTLEWKWAPSCSVASVVNRFCSCKVPVKYCSTRPMTQVFQQMIFPRVSQLSIPDHLFRAHDNESESCVQFLPA